MNPRELFVDHYAFLVGIDEYDHFPDLQGAHSDAIALRDAFHWVGYPKENLWLVPSARTSLDNFDNEIGTFLEETDKSRKFGYNPDIIVFGQAMGFLVTTAAP